MTLDELSEYYYNLPYDRLCNKAKIFINNQMQMHEEDKNRNIKDYKPEQEGYKPDKG